MLLFVVAAAVRPGEAALESKQAGAWWRHSSSCEPRQRPRRHHQQNRRRQVRFDSVVMSTYAIILLVYKQVYDVVELERIEL